MKKFLLLFAFVPVLNLAAQHQHHQHTSDDSTKNHKNEKSKSAPEKSSGHQHDSLHTMSHAYSLNLPMTRNGSGTAWLPDSSVMYGHGIMSGDWMFMTHWNAFLRYNKQDLTNQSNRGGEKIDAPNMLMFMGQRPVGARGLFHFSTMFSLDPFTVGEEGYPLLFQSGETYNGQPLVDRQHPHDLLSELSIGYTHAFSRNVDLTGYFGFPGEPAIGPVAFMHRLSAMNNPDAPLGHHWQDATHITFGVATIGLRIHQVKLEASMFTGREPDENRYDFDRPRFDSYAMRVLYNPNAFLALQVSHAFIRSPEWLHPEDDVNRTTASVTHQLPLGGMNRFLASTVLWGYNDGHSTEHSALAETNLQLDRTAVYARYEWVQKSAEELDLVSDVEDEIFPIQQLTVGASYVVLRKFGSNLSAGAQLTVFAAPRLTNIYGDYPLSAEVYIRFYPQVMHMHIH